MYEWQHGDVVYYDEPGFNRVWIGVVSKHIGDFGTRVNWWSDEKGRFMPAQIPPSRDEMILVGTVNENWVEWDL